MTVPQQIPEDLTYRFSHRHLLGIEGLSPDEISYLLDLADTSDPVIASEVAQLKPRIAVVGEMVALAKPVAQLAAQLGR